MVLVASVPQDPGKVRDLGSISRLDFTVTFASEQDQKALSNHVTTDFIPTVRQGACRQQGR